MRVLREQDFDGMATRVVDRFMNGDKLADAATSTAMESALNPDQIERLVESANTMAFLRLMDQQKAQAATNGPDMTHEFDPIDARQIIQQIVGNTDVPAMGDGHPMDAGSPDLGSVDLDDSAPLPDERKKALPNVEADNATSDDDDDVDEDDDGPFPMSSKDKAAKKKKKGAPFIRTKMRDDAKEAAFRSRRQRKLADVLEDQYKQAEWAFEDTFAGLIHHLKQASNKTTLEVFEKDALALGADGVGITVQNLVREARGWPLLTSDTARNKHAKLADRHVVIETDVTRAFERLVKIASEAARLKSGADWLKSQCS